MRIKTNLSTMLFCGFWVPLQIGKGLGLVSSDAGFLPFIVFAVVFGAAKLLTSKWYPDELIKCIGINLIGLLAYLFSGTSTFFLTFFAITAIKDVDVSSALKISLFIRSLFFLLRTTLSIIGVISPEVSYRYYNGAVAETRYALGFGHPNTAQFELLMLVVMLFVLYFNRIKLLHVFLILLYNQIIFEYTDSRAPYFLCIFFCLFIALIRNNPYKIIKKLVNVLCSNSWIFGWLFTIVGCSLYKHVPRFRNFGTFSSRFLTANLVLDQGWPLIFGQPNITTDQGYIYALYSAGILFTIVFFWLYIKFSKLTTKTDNIALKFYVACLSIFLIVEHTAFSVLSNGLLLYFSYVVFPKSKSREELILS